MTYALPWRYSTTELKGPRLIQFLNKELATMSLVHIFITAYTYYILYEISMKLEYIYIDTFYLHSGSLRNNKLDLLSEYNIGKMGLLILDILNINVMNYFKTDSN